MNKNFEYSIFAFRFSPVGEIHTMAARDHHEILFLTKFINRFKHEVQGFEILSIEHYKDGNKIEYKPQYPFSPDYEIDEEIKKSIQIELDEKEPPIDISDCSFGENDEPCETVEEFLERIEFKEPITIALLECDIEIILKNDMIYKKEYNYSQTNDKDNDLISTPSAFLKQCLEMFDYESVDEINIKIKKEN